jgi:hypothetical protein
MSLEMSLQRSKDFIALSNLCYQNNSNISSSFAFENDYKLFLKIPKTNTYQSIEVQGEIFIVPHLL